MKPQTKVLSDLQATSLSLGSEGRRRTTEEKKAAQSGAVVNEVFSPESSAVYSTLIIALIFQSLFIQSDCCY